MSQSQDRMPVVDVLMTAYNAERTVTSSAESILNQTVVPLRLIVVDDGSTDGTAARLAVLSNHDARVTVIRKPNGGIVSAARVGLEACSAEFLARQDADDLSFPQRLSRQLAHLARNPGCVAVSGAAYHIDEHGDRTGFLVALDPPDKANPATIPSREPYVMHPFMLARRAAVVTAGGYRDLEYAEDTDLCWRLQERGRLDNLPEALGEYRVHTSSVSSNSVISGRISAMNSQLSAVSAMRRRRGRADLSFTPADVGRYRAAATLPAMLALIDPQLDECERSYLRAASAAKLLELSLYRPYRLDVEDCAYISRTCLAGADAFDPAVQSHLRYLRAEVTAKLLLEGRYAEARVLAVGLRRLSVARRIAERIRWVALAPLRRGRPRAFGRDLEGSQADQAFLAAIAARS